MRKSVWINLGVGAACGAVAYMVLGLSAPLSLAACFIVASILNLASVKHS